MIDPNKAVSKWQHDTALERFKMVSPLLDADIDRSKRIETRKKISEQFDVSVRTLYRYESAYKANGFEGLIPENRSQSPSKKLPENFEELLKEAIQLKREVPSRSTSQIILILEMEDRVAPGALKRSTLHRYLFKAGFGKKQMRKFTEAQKSSSKRFCKPHRMMLAQADYPDVLFIPIFSAV